ncbi:MAG: hypothetical protein JNJ50_06985 [Acidobacteria bacterium]|nr:hypothetical protein [Acidobacteriota bacterium]
MNPHWINLIYQAVKKSVKRCPHCGKRGTYAKKRPGQFYICKHCRHRFKERDAA